MNEVKFSKKRQLQAIIASCILGLTASIAIAEVAEPTPEPVDLSVLKSMKGIQPAPVYGIEKYVKDKNAAIKLGKALFWEMQAGSQGQSCASCHFHAGADNRIKNQLSPGLKHTEEDKREIFDPTRTGHGGPNYTLKKEDFPFRVYQNPDDRESYVMFDSDDVVSSQGVFASTFDDLFGADYDQHFTDGREGCTNINDIFHVTNIGTRRIEPRNTPTVINAIFNFRNFWDGRANNVFNGIDPFGRRNKDAKVMHFDRYSNTINLKEVNLVNSSAASQAVGPPGSDFEMTCASKAFQSMAKKLLRLVPLGLQQVDKTDSVLGYLSAYPNNGLRTSYRQMIQDAFHEDLWGYSRKIDDFEQIEHNFSLFWGLAIQLYEATLISDDSRYDQYVEGDKYALTDEEIKGMELFVGKGKCINCHSGPEFSKAATHLNPEQQEGGLVERMIMGDNNAAIYDNGFYNIGVRPTKEDIGLGGDDPWGNPLSFTRQAQQMAAGKNVPDSFEVDHNTFEVDPNEPVKSDERNAVDGSFKVPSLRNVELTGPYMHNGSMSTLFQVVTFYNRGGNREDMMEGHGDSTGFGENGSNLDPDINNLGLTLEEKYALVAFLKTLTDERVRWEKAPFDHPQLHVPVGAIGDEYAVTDNGNGIAEEEWMEVPMVGAGGRYAKGLSPIEPFMNDKPVSSVYAKDDYPSVKYRYKVTFDVTSNDYADGATIDMNSVTVINGPDPLLGKLENHGNGSFTYTATRAKDATFTYTVKDSYGNLSNVATVTIKVSY